MTGWDFSVKHMDAVRQALAACPAGLFMGFSTASAKRDMEQATDLVMQLNGGTFAVRVRSRKHWDNGYPDMSVRYYCRGRKTEIHKLREGFADWYFCGWSSGPSNGLIGWCILDVNKMRDRGVLRCTKTEHSEYTDITSDCRWQVNDNRDATAGMYIPTIELWREGCVIYSHNMGFTGKVLEPAKIKADAEANKPKPKSQPELFENASAPAQLRH